MLNEQLNELYPFLQYDPYNPYCYKKCPKTGWMDNVPQGWKDLVVQLLPKLKILIEKHNISDIFRINYIGPRNGVLDITYDGVSTTSYKEIYELIDYYCKTSRNICCACGQRAIIIENNLPFCNNCINKDNFNIV